MPAAAPPAIVYLVDDDASLRGALGRLLKAAGYDVRAYASSEEFLLAGVDEAPGCLLLDLNLPGPSGLDLQQALARRGILLPVIFLTGRGDVQVSVRAMKAGAVDFLTKPVPSEVLLQAIADAVAADAQAQLARARVRTWRERYETLTPREAEVFVRVIAGKLNKVIAAEPGAAERTVKLHRARVMEKMGAASLAELVHIARELRVTGPAAMGDGADRRS